MNKSLLNKITLPILWLVILAFFPHKALGCGGENVILSDNPSAIAFKTVPAKNGYIHYDPLGDLILEKAVARVSPEKAWAIVERFRKERIPSLTNGFRFRKLELVHGKLIYQFESVDPLPGYNGKYHLGPVNFIVDHVIVDVDSRTGELFLANGCGAAPGQLLARYDIKNITPPADLKEPFISDNTNFIARKTGNKITIDGFIGEDEWQNTAHRYFYIGEYAKHSPSTPHKKPFYHVEVWSQLDDENIYFAVKTDTPYWVGLMFKGDSNLGMLWSYLDAKLMKSNGEITDRFFTQRKDKTFFLERDTEDNIVASAKRQDDLYTYEFAFPLKTTDKNDISFEIGKAYNMLVLVGNTLDHYGIFTLDDAHKNHDHSKNNKEHADVWASSETTLRIGTPPAVDIFGEAVTPQYDNYTSGYDPLKNDTHFHYAAHTFKDVSNRFQLSSYINFVTIFFGIIGMAFLFVKTGNEKPLSPQGDMDLFRYGPVRAFFRSRYYRYLITIPVLIVFIVIIIAGLFDTQDGRQNIATIYTWTVWWTLIIFSFILAGRLWCMVCPFAFLGDLAQKVVSFNKKLPRFMQNMGFQTLGFIALTFAYAYFSLYQKPFATSLLILGILLAAILGSIIFRKRTFCRYLCPIGAVIGLYSTVSPFKITPSSQNRCINHKSKTCSGECPMLEDPYELDSNLYCNYCMKCIPSCPSENLSLKYRGFGRDILEGIQRSPVEAVASLMLFGLVLYETLAMTTALPAIKGFISNHYSIASDTLLTGIIYLGVIAAPSLIFISLCYGLSIWLGGRYTTWQLLKEYAFSFIPLGIGLHLAHNLSHLFTEAPVAVPATIRFLGKAGLMDTGGINWNPLPPVGADWIFLLQMLTIIVGFLSSIFLLYKTTKRLEIGVSGALKTAIVMTTFAIISVSITFYMIGLPMNGRHVH